MSLPTVTFATCCWEKDWRPLLLDPCYLQKKLIQNHLYSFQEKLLVINNVEDRAAVQRAAALQVEARVLSRFVLADERILSHFHLQCADFSSDWVFYNALGPLTAISECQSEYLLYLTGDVRLDTPVDWIPKALLWMQRESQIKVANLTWNGQYSAARKESYRTTWNFYRAKQGFSDQMFLVRKKDFCQPIYWEVRPDAAHFPRGDVFEKRVFSYMKNRGWERITYRRGSYTHENF